MYNKYPRISHKEKFIFKYDWFFYHMHVVERWILEHDGADDHDVYPVSGPPPLLLPLQKGNLQASVLQTIK